QTRAITRYKSRYDSLSSLVIAEVRNIWGFGLFDIPAGVNFTRRTQLICAQVSLVVLGQIFTLRIWVLIRTDDDGLIPGHRCGIRQNPNRARDSCFGFLSDLPLDPCLGFIMDLVADTFGGEHT